MRAFNAISSLTVGAVALSRLRTSVCRTATVVAVLIALVGAARKGEAQVIGMQLQLRPATAGSSGPTDPQLRISKPVEVVEATNGEIFIVENQVNELRVFDANWREIGKAGSARPGPGQIRFPNRLRMLNDGSVGVVDAMRGLVTFKRQQQALVPTGVVQPVQGATDMCMLGSTVVAMTEDTGKTIHSVAREEGKAHSYVDAPPGESRLVVSQYAQGKLLCADKQNFVVVAYQNLGEVRAYGENGSLAWKRVLTGFDPYVIKADDNGATVTSGPAGSHHLVTFTLVSDSVILLQGEKQSANKSIAQSTVISFLIDAKTGNVFGTQADLPVALGVSRTHFFSYSKTTGQITRQEFALSGNTRAR